MLLHKENCQHSFDLDVKFSLQTVMTTCLTTSRLNTTQDARNSETPLGAEGHNPKTHATTLDVFVIDASIKHPLVRISSQPIKKHIAKEYAGTNKREFGTT